MMMIHQRLLEVWVSKFVDLISTIDQVSFTNLLRNLLPVAEAKSRYVNKEAHRKWSNDEAYGDSYDAHPDIEAENYRKRMTYQEETCEDKLSRNILLAHSSQSTTQRHANSVNSQKECDPLKMAYDCGQKLKIIGK